MSEHFTLKELTASDTAVQLHIDNTPSHEVVTTLILTMAGLERIRAYLCAPILVLSGFRCFELNKAVGGKEDSQHLKGEACDFIAPHLGTPKEIVQRLMPMVRVLGIDQLIFEGTWVHVSFSLYPRYEVYSLVDGKYIEGIV